MARTLQEPWNADHNIRVYDNDGAILASMHVRPEISLYVTHSMLYRYCNIILVIPAQGEWGLYPLLDTGLPGHLLQCSCETPVKPGNYLVLDQKGKNPIQIQFNPETPPYRISTRDQNSQSQSQDQSEASHLQRSFRNNLVMRDEKCAITQEADMPGPGFEHLLLRVAHIIPTSQMVIWNRDYKKDITDESPSATGESRIYSPRNGLLLGIEEHILFDQFIIGVDPMADYKVICFGIDFKGFGGKRLKESAIHGANAVPGVHPHILQWHLRMCVLAHMKANAELRVPWEEDLGDDDMGQILEQDDAGQRMETELFTRLGEYIA